MIELVRDLFEKTGAGFVALICVLVLSHQVYASILDGRAADPVGVEIRTHGGFIPKRRPEGVHLIVTERAAIPNLIAAAVKVPAISYFDFSRSKNVRGRLAVLRRMRNVHTLILSETDVRDADLVHVARMENLMHLDLRGTAVTGAGLAVVAAIPSLEKLVVMDVPLTDAEHARLKSLTKAEIVR